LVVDMKKLVQVLELVLDEELELVHFVVQVLDEELEMAVVQHVGLVLVEVLELLQALVLLLVLVLV